MMKEYGLLISLLKSDKKSTNGRLQDPNYAIFRNFYATVASNFLLYHTIPDKKHRLRRKQRQTIATIFAPDL